MRRRQASLSGYIISSSSSTLPQSRGARNIYGYEGSTAESYAKKYHRAFRTISLDAPDYDWANADCSESASPEHCVDVSDVILMSHVAAEDTKVSLTEQGKMNANVCNPSENKIDGDDIVMVLKYIARLIDYSELGK